MNLELDLFGNPLREWLTALGIALAINVVVGLVNWLLVSRLSKIAPRTVTRVDDAFLGIVRATRQWLVLLVTILVGAQYLELPKEVFAWLKNIAAIAFFLQIGLWAGAALKFWVNSSRERASESNLGAATSLAALSFIGSVVIWAIVLLLTLSNLGIDVTAMIAGLGVGGVAVALAVQNILGDLFASLSIVIDKPFVIGDFIIVDTYMGTVEHVGLKTTRVRAALSGEQLVFSNSDLLKSRIQNFKLMRERRVLFAFSVPYETTQEQLKRVPGIVKAAIEAQKLTRYERAHLLKLGTSSLDFEVVYWMLDPDYNLYMDAQQGINLQLLREFEQAGISFAYPTTTVISQVAGAEDAAAAGA